MFEYVAMIPWPSVSVTKALVRTQDGMISGIMDAAESQLNLLIGAVAHISFVEPSKDLVTHLQYDEFVSFLGV